MEFKVDGQVRETLSSSPWESKINVSDGVSKIEVRAEDEKGNSGSKSVEIGVKQPWAAPSPTPTPTP